MKKILIFTQDDPFFINPILNRVTKRYKKFKIEVVFSKSSLNRKIKTAIILILFSNLYNFFKLFFKREKLTNKITVKKNVQIKEYFLVLCISHQKKILVNNRVKIYNFHLGNIESQRGSFIFFYKFKYFWSHINLTCHLMSNIWDAGKIVGQKKIYCKKLDAIEILNLYKKNIFFIYQFIDSFIKKKKIKIIKIKKKLKTHKQPTLIEIFKVYFSLKQ